MGNPRYSYPPALIAGVCGSILFGGKRSFRADALACVQRLHPPLRVQGAGNIPAAGPCVLTVNHYHRPGFGAWWIALALAATLPLEAHWTMTDELTFPGRWYAFAGRAGSRWLLKRAARMYAFTSMPPMPPRPQDTHRRAGAVLALLRYVRLHPNAVLALAPEGGDAPGGVLASLPSGAGRFLLLLAGAGFPVVPVGCWEESGALCLRFGPAYRLQVPPGAASGERDRLAGEAVMHAIACQLPARLQGTHDRLQPGA